LKLLIPSRDPGNVYLTHYNRHVGNDYPNGDHRYDDVKWMYEELKDWRRRFRSMTYPVDKSVPDTYWGELAQFLEIPSETIFNGDVMSFLHAGHKYGSAKSSYRIHDVELPKWVRHLRYDMGYTARFNPAGYIGRPHIEGHGDAAPTLPRLR
jgi:hypothetical protein